MEALCLYNLEKQNFRKLFSDVMYSNEDTYPIYMEVATLPSNALLRFMSGNMHCFLDISKKYRYHPIQQKERSKLKIQKTRL